MTAKQIEAVQTLADCSLSVKKAAEKLGIRKNTLRERITRIRAATGKDPLSFRDLVELLGMCDRVYVEVKCAVCGKIFESETSQATMCSDECRAIAHKAAMERYKLSIASQQKHYERVRKMRETEECDVCNRTQPKVIEHEKRVIYKPIQLNVFPDLSIAQMNAKARAAGMSYGKYSAMVRYGK